MPPEGEVRRNPRLRVGVYNQHFVERLPMDEDPVTYLRRLFNEETYQSVRNKLGELCLCFCLDCLWYCLSCSSQMTTLESGFD